MTGSPQVCRVSDCPYNKYCSGEYDPCDNKPPVIVSNIHLALTKYLWSGFIDFSMVNSII